MNFTVIINPVAGGGHGRTVGSRVVNELRARNIVPTVLETRVPGEATTFARGVDAGTVLAIGGDGTINEVVNGIRPGVRFGVIPAGSGNDFIKAVGIPKNPQQALDIALDGKIRQVDVGRYLSEGVERQFVNGIGIGFDAAVAVKKSTIPFLGGTLVYVAAVFGTLGRFKAPSVTMTGDGISIERKLLLIAIGNGPCAGGGFYLTPQADASDGLLDVCCIDDVSVATILRLFPLVLFGKHTAKPQVAMYRAAELTVQCSLPVPVHADGEIIGTDVREMNITLRKKALPVICA
jgi:YegS/Rv2252/BmrU family lipid kinase